MVSPNLFLKINISFSSIIGFLIIYQNISKSQCKLYVNLIGMFFLFYAINNMVILKQKSNPKLKKDILRINTLLYIFLIIFLLLELLNTQTTDPALLLMICLSFFGLINNYLGYKFTRKNFINTMKDRSKLKRNLKNTIFFVDTL
jgi:hypothetical protein